MRPALCYFTTMTSRLHALHAAGQAVWLDYIDRDLVRSGALAQRINDDALTGMTSNPTIFEKALAQGTLYDAQIAAATTTDAWALFETIAADDVRTACDAFRSVYDATHGADGYVSLEVSPRVAHDTAGTVAEGQRLWVLVDRPNLMIKVPATPEGIPAVRALIAAGINVNVTLLFAVAAHAEVIEAYISGLEDRAATGADISHVSSVASFFISRVDSAIDARLRDLVQRAVISAHRGESLQGRAAIANAKLAYRLAMAAFAGPRWEALHAQGARVQRPLWASTSTKDPAYRDVLYVEQLIGPHTVNTMPPATLEAFRDHGETARTIDAGVEEADALLAELEALGIALTAVTDQLLQEGLASFATSFETLLAGLAAKAAAVRV
jgi:transaldolase